MPRSKYPREVAVDYELVYSINKVSWVTGNLMKAKDTHMKRILHTERTLRAQRGHPEGTRGPRGHSTTHGDLFSDISSNPKNRKQWG